jgi:hypothetical protein
MATQYLSEQKIKELKNYLKANLPAKVRATFMQIKLKTGLELYHINNTKVDNIRAFIQYCDDELKRDINHPLNAQFVSFKFGDNKKAYDMLMFYINDKYAQEWQTLNAFDVDKALQFLHGFGILGFFKENNVEPTELAEFMTCENVDELIDQRYSKKAVPKELLQRTTEFKKIVDGLFEGKNTGLLMDAIVRYLNDPTKDESTLHNNINRT